MLPRTSKLWVLTTGLVFGAAMQCGCGNTISVIGSPDQPGKVVLNPSNGDTIQWTGITPSFLGPSPCSTDASNGKCKVSVSDGSYLYSCNGCADPEVVVGPQSGNPFRRLGATTVLATSDSVSLWCNNNQVSLAPAAAPFTAHAGDSLEVFWVNTGTGSQKIPDPQVTPGPSAPPISCKEGSIGKPPDNHCTFTAPAATTTYYYTAKSAGGGCNATSATGTVVVTIQ